jgi:serine/threonine-protein kinase
MMSAGRTEARSRKRIGKYAVTGRIGQGGMGMVYRAYDEVLEREVAVKVLTAEGGIEDEYRKRFAIEAKAAARLQHPNIVTVFELGEDRGVPFIAMELLSGADLDGLLRSGEPLLLQESLDIMIQVCRGLHFAHEHRIIHRDVKPSNVRVLEDGSVKIMDFGIAKLGSTGLTKSGMMVGTVHYMSPEQIRAKPLDGRSDVFSAGVILYELLSGKRPFVGEGATDVLIKIVQAPTPHLAREQGPSEEPLQAIVDRALAKNPDDRYASAAHLADDLARTLSAHMQSGAASPADVLESVSAARRLLKEGQVQESFDRLTEITANHPQLAEARRVLRWARRELQRRQRAPEPEDQDFPELEATFKASPPPAPAKPAAPEAPLDPTVLKPTVLQPAVMQPALQTVLQPTVLQPAVRGASPQAGVVAQPGWRGGALWGGLAAAAVAVIVGLVVLGRGSAEKKKTQEPSPVAVSPSAPAPAGAVAVEVVSEPRGAAVSVDGQRLAGVTPMTIRLDPSVEHRVAVSRDGHAPQEVRLTPGSFPSEVRVSLEPAGPMGKVMVTSSYPVDVIWKGKVLAKAQASAQVSVPLGQQTLTLASGAYALRVNLPVEVRAGTVAEVRAPELGRINIKANPDNCQVLIDGTFIDYPPILDRPLSTGTHTVTFKWPDGARKDESVSVAQGTPTYVMGRRD